MPDQVTVWSMPHTVEQRLNAAQEAAPEAVDNPSEAFQRADAFTALHEGGITRDDGNRHTAAFGIDQAAHPNIDVTKLTPERAQAMRYEYWRAVGGEELAKKSPALAEAAYDTAIMSGPDRAQQFLKGAQGDPKKFLSEREQFFHHLEQNPQYARAAPGWEARNQDLRVEIHNTSAPPSVASMKNETKKREASIKSNKYSMRTPPNKLRNLYT